MEYLHAGHISHRDIKLENILYTQDEVIKLIDFGFAIQSKTKLKTFCGTPTYMAPELVKKKEYYGPHVDMWALGVMLYRMLTGTYPFMAKMDRDLYKKITEGTFNSELVLNLEARDLICRLLKVNPAERLTATEVAPFLSRCSLIHGFQILINYSYYELLSFQPLY